MPHQIGNVAKGSIAGRDIHLNLPHERTPMTKLVEQYRAESEADPKLTSLIENLQHFFSSNATSDVRGLEVKLTCSGRGDLLQDALTKKQAAYKLIMKNQGSKSAQLIFTFVLAEIVVNFEQAVRPLVQSKAARVDIDKAILDHVITPAVKLLEDNPLMLSKLDIQGFLYFLGGNCHVRWDPC